MLRHWASKMELSDIEMGPIPGSIDAVHCAQNIGSLPPSLDEALLNIYHESFVQILDSPTAQHQLQMEILLCLQRSLEHAYPHHFERFQVEWGTDDILLQKLIYIFVKYSTWQSVTFDPKRYRHPADDTDLEPPINKLLQLATFLSQPEYLIPVGDHKVLILLATHLQMEGVLKMAIGKVVMMAQRNQMQKACIMSLNHVVIVQVDKTSSQVKLRHIRLLKIVGDDLQGKIAFISTLSLLEYRFELTPKDGNLPVEIIEMIFKELALQPDGGETISHFIQTCKMFAKIACHHAVQLPGLILLSHATCLMRSFYGIDNAGRVGI